MACQVYAQAPCPRVQPVVSIVLVGIHKTGTDTIGQLDHVNHTFSGSLAPVRNMRWYVPSQYPRDQIRANCVVLSSEND